jgi:hypothetical protein
MPLAVVVTGGTSLVPASRAVSVVTVDARAAVGELADGVDIVPQPASARTTAAPHTLRSNFVELIIGVSKPWVLLRCRRRSSGMAHHIT